MLSVDFRRLGRFIVTPPAATLRAFRTAPRIRIVPVPRLATRALLLRAGGIHAWVMAAPGAPAWPIAFYFEVETLPGFALRAAWLRGAGRALARELFPDPD